MDNLTKAQRHKNMRNIRSKGTLPERMIMQALRRKGIYFAANVSSLTGKPDLVFRRKRVVVFIDSDFWHGHPKRFIMPSTNRKYWQSKIARNRRRDRLVTATLKKQRWRVLRFWEYDVKHNIDKVLDKILSALE